MNAIVILAAGSSSRMGLPKQNLVYKGQTLLQAAIKNAVSVSENVLVVLGANRENIEHTITDQHVNIIYNPNWPEGMASSISLAIDHIQTAYLQITSVLFMLCDQPFADEKILKQLIDTASATDKGIVACTYYEAVGVPALFKQKYFPYLLALKGKDGAKKLFELHADDVETIPFPLGNIDIDTAQDYNRLKGE
ncbi:nucleotidyltransferase family protein [Inquilinus sp. KBS0705]|nr:nucleotidyltransferase family protein [Inquilinus sp. KBS0705]